MSKEITTYSDEQAIDLLEMSGFAEAPLSLGPIVKLNYSKTDLYGKNEFLTSTVAIDGEVVSLGRTFKAQILLRTSQLKHFDSDGLAWWSNEFIAMDKPITIFERMGGDKEPKETIFQNYYDIKRAMDTKGAYKIHYYLEMNHDTIDGVRRLTLSGTSQDAFFKYRKQIKSGEHPMQFMTEFTTITNQGPDGDEYYTINATKLEQIVDRNTQEYTKAAEKIIELHKVVMSKNFFPKREEVATPKVEDSSPDDLDEIFNTAIDGK